MKTFIVVAVVALVTGSVPGLASIIHDSPGGAANEGKYSDRERWPKLDILPEPNENVITLDAQQTLLDYETELDLGDIVGIVPVFRYDLPAGYTAYAEVNYTNNAYLLVSTGRQTGDHRLAVQGEHPTLSKQVDKAAADNGETCSTYYLLLPEVMTCHDVNGKIVAANIPLEDFNTNLTLADFVETNTELFRELWIEVTISSTEEWEDTLRMSEEGYIEWLNKVASEATEEKEQDVDDEEAEGIMASALEVDQPTFVAVGDPTELIYVEVRSVEPETKAPLKQRALCQLLDICDGEDNLRVNEDKIQTNKFTGFQYLTLTVEDASAVEELDDLDIVLALHLTGNQVVMKRFGLSDEVHREKRRISYRNPGRWAERHIPCSQSYFPDYDQHTQGRCAVGCGPVAWAMIFGFYDRAGHGRCGRYRGSTALYRCDGGGLTGSSGCVAPQHDIPHAYTEQLKSQMRTFCVFENGATPANRMNDVQDFFRARQQGGSIYTKKCPTAPFYCNETRGWAKGKVDQGWPVLIGFRLSALSWHYPVATGYRTRRAQRRRCVGFCGPWRWSTQSEWYLHMEWGAGRVEWKTMDAYAAWTAQF